VLSIAPPNQKKVKHHHYQAAFMNINKGDTSDEAAL
jgi:hypothetical protein